MSGDLAQALKVECPVCFSPPSWRCIRGVTANGTDYLSDEPHATRVLAAALKGAEEALAFAGGLETHPGPITLDVIKSVTVRGFAALRALLSAAREHEAALPGVREAFVAGAAWWEYETTGGTIWTSDRRKAEAEAERRYPTAEWIESPRLTASEARAEKAEAALAEARSEIDHWRVKARCYGDIVHGCSPALAAAGFPVDGAGSDGAVGGIARAVTALSAALAEERERRERAERELAAAVEFHLHALDATYRCLPLGKPDTEPDRWVAIAHRMTKLEAALLLIRDGEGDARDIAWNALESALRAAPAQREKGDDDAAL